MRQYAIAAGAAVVATAVPLLLMRGLGNGGEFGLDPGVTLVRYLFFVGGSMSCISSVGLAIVSAWLYLCAEAEHTAAAEQCAIDAERMDHQTAEARLQMLEAQIEPHFLFNTLAHVRRLYETDPAAGARMLHNLARYLAGALPQMRAAATLGRELDHVAAYLNIQQIRMGRRLAFAIDVPAALRDAALPPLMVLTLVENAIKHGLSPLREGGRIDVRASVGRRPLDAFRSPTPARASRSPAAAARGWPTRGRGSRRNTVRKPASRWRSTSRAAWSRRSRCRTRRPQPDRARHDPAADAFRPNRGASWPWLPTRCVASGGCRSAAPCCSASWYASSMPRLQRTASSSRCRKASPRRS